MSVMGRNLLGLIQTTEEDGVIDKLAMDFFQALVRRNLVCLQS